MLFPLRDTKARFLVDRSVLLFWDCTCFTAVGGKRWDWYPDRAVYICSAYGGDDEIHAANVRIRNLGFEPIVIRELKQHRDRRDALRGNDQLIDKPKGCDIALATRMVADAAANLYDECLLYTSDRDFLPAIEAVRRMGKSVTVYGYADVRQARSPLLYMPDYFVDLGVHLRKHINNLGESLVRTALQLGGKTVSAK